MWVKRWQWLDHSRSRPSECCCNTTKPVGHISFWNSSWRDKNKSQVKFPFFLSLWDNFSLSDFLCTMGLFHIFSWRTNLLPITQFHSAQEITMCTKQGTKSTPLLLPLYHLLKLRLEHLRGVTAVSLERSIFDWQAAGFNISLETQQ